MEARCCFLARTALRFAPAFLCLGGFAHPLFAAVVQTTNFVVDAPSKALATQLAEAAEQYRRMLAIDWLGHELPPWDERCPVRASIQRGAGGATSFCFTRGRVHDWKMEIQG